MTLYLTGILIDCTAILATGGYYIYCIVKSKELDEPRHYYWIIIVSIGGVLAASLYYVCMSDLTTASILAWVMAVPVTVTTLFILLIIIFRPDWK
ncbi:hypothetical protein LZD49_00410 [Dyadobacter sp. CY261]|uniref:hypothetical protein n=1 Tax=Dyadobacter sp. CY261 TaxID=2907203 RepID=UPI001F18DD29|nr:hypothetical protein [Dyadobacter sp. CY261]MCF0068909.1 hypothetical protein [Dyadobacter sp. CY261]